MAEEVKILYSRIPLPVTQHKTLSLASKLLMGEIIGLAQRIGHAYASNTTYAERISVSPATIKRSLIELEEAGYIVRDYPSAEKGYKNVRHIYVNETLLEEESSKITEERLQNKLLKAEKRFPTFKEEEKDEAQVEPHEVRIEPHEVQVEPHEVQNDTTPSVNMSPERFKNDPHKNQLSTQSINQFIIQSINQKKDTDSEQKVGFSNESQIAEKPSSKDNRPIGLSLPSVNDDSLLKNDSQSISSKEKSKIAYDYSFNTREYLASKASSGFKKTAALYPNQNNLEKAAPYYATIVSGELNLSGLRQAVEQLPKDEPREFLEYLEFMVEQKRDSSLIALEASLQKTK